jgi:signal transduction histidine kinase
VIVQNGDIMHDFVTHQKLGQDRLMAVETPAEGLQLLAAGRGDAMLMGKFQGLYLIRTLGLEGVVPVGPSLEGRQYAFAVKKGDEALVAALNEGLRIVKESGQYDALHEKWFGVTSDRWSRNEIGLVLGWIVAPACVSLVLVLAWNQGLRRLVAKKTASLEQELAARVRAEGQLQELAAQLRNTVHVRTAEYDAASSELEGFCYSVAHDLRAPLRAINGYATMLQEECKQPSYPPCRQYLERIRHSAKSLGTLIDSLLSLSQLTRSPMRRETVDISAIARGLAAELQSREPSRRAEIHVQPEMTVVGDAHLLEEAMRQLLGNAWKFSSKKEQTEIRVACEVVDGERVFSVSDRGAGFDMAHATNLFRPFYRLHAVGEFEGSAIGLATVDRIVRRHGGRVWAQGEPDSGATFYFALRDAGEPATSTCRLGETSAGGEVSSQ